MDNRTDTQNKRNYVRIPTVFPVEFYLSDEEGIKSTSWIQGFTQNIAKGGICLLVNDIWQGFWEKLHNPKELIYLRINVPFRRNPITLKAKCVWVNKEKLKEFDQCVCGVEFLNADEYFTKALYRYAIFRKNIPRAVGALMVIFTGVSLFLFGQHHFLVQENRKLVKDYVGILKQSTSLQQSLSDKEQSTDFISSRRKEIKSTVELLEYETAERIMRKKDIMQSSNRKVFFDDITELEEELDVLALELVNLKKEDIFLAAKENESEALKSKIKEEFNILEKEKIDISRRVMKGLYDWIKNRQNLSTGLILSYEGDRELERASFTYDQALAAILFLVNDQEAQAKKIMDFFLAKALTEKEIYNSYYSDGSGHEYIKHAGPCAWIGLAALQYVDKTKQTEYLKIAYLVDEFLQSLKDKDGGIRGGPKDSWYSTEHNLDSYAFYMLFYEITKKKEYLKQAQEIKSWINRYAYTEHNPPVKRGKGDATIATDTYSWSIASIGPKELFGLKMNPEAILEFAIEQCSVESQFQRREGRVIVKGFDFAKSKNSARGGVISGEWTSQMILAFEIMADYFREADPSKSKHYLQQALFYFNELQKMIITSPSRAGREDPCLPYASRPSVDTGHGWRTPKGNRTGSLAATVYFLLAYEGYNPLTGKYLDKNIKQYYAEVLKEKPNINTASSNDQR
jgi:PilZ domain-containing protein